MPLASKNIPSGGGNRIEQPNIEPGTYPARTVQIIDLGLQKQRPYLGKEKKPAYEVLFTYELVDVFMKDEDGNDVEDKPRWLSETLPWFGINADRAKSAQRYAAFDPAGVFEGDLSKCIDIPVNVVIVNNESNGKVYDNIAGVTAMRKKDADKCDPLKNAVKVFDLSDPDIDVFNSLPDWIKDKIKDNLEFNGSPLQKLLSGKTPPKEEKAPAKETPAKPAPAEDDDEEDNIPW